MIDITRMLSEHTAVWPGDKPVRILRDEAPDGGPLVSAVCMTLHAGTHADAPLHYFPEGEDIASLGIAPFIGPCTVLELPEGEMCVGEALMRRLKPGTRRLLIKTPASFLTESDYMQSGFGLDLRAAEQAVQDGLTLVGVDGPSVGVPGSEGDQVHRLLLRAGIAVVEGLDLSGVRERAYELCCLPLRFKGTEASPVRAVLFEWKEGGQG